MRIFLAGATGVIGNRLLPLLVADAHTVAGMTRSSEKTDKLRALGAEPVACDVLDAPALTEAVMAFEPDAVLHQVTDLPDRVDELPAFAARNDRVRTVGTRNLVAAAGEAGAGHFLAQSIAWRPPGRGGVVEEHERVVLEIGGVVVRYGQLYGPGTFYETRLPPHLRIHVDDAARRTPALISAPSGVQVLTDDPEPANRNRPGRRASSGRRRRGTNDRQPGAIDGTATPRLPVDIACRTYAGHRHEELLFFTYGT